MTLKQGINLTIRNVVVSLTIGILLVLFASTNALAERGPDLAKQHIDKIEAQSLLLYAPTPTRSMLLKKQEQLTIHNRHLICLAKNVYYEAGGESAKGKAAVAHVTLNRANSSLFPDSVCNVVYQKSRSVCQFSWVCMRKTQPITHTERWTESLKIASQAMEGKIQHMVRCFFMLSM